MRFGIVTFPGSNCDYDAYQAIVKLGEEPVYLWHKTHDVQGCDVLVLPGGFSYGDDVAAGKIFANQLAAFLSDEVRKFRDAEKLILGVQPPSAVQHDAAEERRRIGGSSSAPHEQQRRRCDAVLQAAVET